MQTNNLVRKTPNQKRKLIGRGGKRGKTSGRGTKGQWAHGSHGVRPELRDIIKKFPKLRGHGKNRGRTVNSSATRAQVVNLEVIEANFAAGETVSVKTLLDKGLVRTTGGKNPEVKILAHGDFKKKLTFVGLTFSVAGKEKAEKSGSTVQ